MATRIPLILNQTTARIEELAAADTLPGSMIEGFLGKNLLINGDMGIFQRGTLANRPDGEGYTIDRWSFASLGTGTSNWGVGTFTLSDSSPILPVPSPPRYWLGLNIVAGTNTAWLRQKIERVAVYSNGKATLSFWMRSGVAGKKVGVRIIQDFGGGTGASAAVFIEGTVFTLTTSFQKYTYTFDVPSLVGKTLGSAPSGNDCLQVLFDFTSAAGYGGQLAGQTGLFEVTMVQFERGAVATEFDRRPDPIELVLCQRYYEKSYNLGTSPGTATREGCYNSGALTGYLLHAPVVRFSQRKRNTPAITLYNTQDGSAGQLSENAQNGLHVTNKPAAADQIGSMSFEASVPNGTATPGNVERFHWTADAEI